MESSSSENGSTIVLTDAAQGALSSAAVRTEMEKVLAAPCLRDSYLLKRFLRYAVEHTLPGEGGQLKEYSLGVDVFGRDASYDPRVDPVVRMAARRLGRPPAN